MVSLSTANLTDNAIPIIPTSPNDNGDFQGQVKLQVSADRSNLWIWDNNALLWRVIAGAITGTIIPTASVTPNAIGQIYINTTAQTVYVAIGLNNTDWKLIT